MDDSKAKDRQQKVRITKDVRYQESSEVTPDRGISKPRSRVTSLFVHSHHQTQTERSVFFCCLFRKRRSNWGLSNGLIIHSAVSQPWLPPGGGSRGAGGGARVKRHFLRILFLNFRKYSYFPRLNRSYRKAPSVTLRVPPPSRREAQERPRHKINTPPNPN